MSGDDVLLAGRYRLGARIGAGGMGAVHRATDTRLAREVAVKVLSADALGNQVARQRLIREALACAALSHPNIVHVYDVGETDDGGAFLVMELVSGVPLRALIHDDAWPDRARVTAVVEVARALGAAHRAGLIHRDVKPDNVMLRDDGRVVLLDFGIAKAANESTTVTAQGTGAIVGTPAYLSPEQALGASLDARTDEFSLAVTAYELLARKLPWPAISAVSIVTAILSDPAPPLAMTDASLADAVRPVLERAMAKLPERRFPTVDDFADELARAGGLVTLPNAARISGDTMRAPVSTTPEAFARTAFAESTIRSREQPTMDLPSAPKRRRRGLLGAIAGLVVVAGAAAGALAWRARRNPLDVASPVLACPMLEATMDGKPAPWLGAAAAYQLGDDLAPMLGGFRQHVRYPASLLGWPGYAPSAPETDAWDASGLRERARAAAETQGDAWLDGHVEAEGAQLRLTVVVRAPSGRELGRASKSGTSLDAVALSVSRALRDGGALGKPHPLDADYRDYAGVATAEEDDAVTTLVHSTESLAPLVLCKLDRAPRLPPAWRVALDHQCAGGPFDLAVPLEALSVELEDKPEDFTPALEERLAREVATATSPERKAFAMNLKVITDDGETSSFQKLMLAVVAVDPRSGWSLITDGTETDDRTLLANGASWAPDHYGWWCARANELGATDRKRASELLGRAFVLFPVGRNAGLYADSLLRDGNVAAAGSVAAYLATSDGVIDRDMGRVIAAQAAAGDGAFAKTLAKWTEELSQSRVLFGDRYDVARMSAARELAYAIAKERELADAVADSVASDRASLRFDEGSFTSRPNLAVLCGLASPERAKKCLAKLDATLIPKGQRDDWRRVRAVLDAYLAGDFATAANEARPLARVPWFTARLGDFLVDVFDRAGLTDVSDELDAPHVDDENLHGVSLATLRAARRAARRGDKERARELAKRVVAAWRNVDLTVPAVAEMQTLLAAP